MTYLGDSILVGGPGLIAEIIALENAAGEQARGSLHDIGSNVFLREGHGPGIMAGRKF